MSGFSEWARRRLAFPGALRVGLMAALLISLPSLGSGFFGDDFTHLGILEGLPSDATPFDLYRFIATPETLRTYVELGIFPWWSSPDLKLAFFRPLASATAALDFAVFGHWAPGYHAHTILWYLALVAACGLVLRRALPSRLGGLALLLYAVDPSHTVPVEWIANRNALVAVTPALLGLLAHLRFREDGWRPGLPLSLLGFAVGLLGGETALGIFALLGAYELFGRQDRLPARVLALAPAAALGALYLTAYKRMGYGAAGSGFYIDPLTDPRAFLAALPLRLLALAGGEISHVGAEFSVLSPTAALVQYACGAVALVILALLLRWAWPGLSPEERRGTRWLLAGSLLALLPVASTMPHARLLLVASLGGSVAVSAVLREGWRRWSVPGRRQAFRLGAAGAALYLGTGLLGGAVGTVAAPLMTRGLLSSVDRLASTEGCCANRDLVVLADADFMAAMYTPMVMNYRKHPLPRSWRVLSMAPCNHRLRRTGPSSLELACVDGRMLQTQFEALFRSPAQPLRQGARVELASLTATMLDEAPDGGFTRVEFRFAQPLESASYLFFIRREGRYERVNLPPVGGSLDLPLDTHLAQ